MDRRLPAIAIAITLGVSLALPSASPCQNAPEKRSARDVIKEARDKQFPKNSVMDITMVLTNKGGSQRVRKIQTKRKTLDNGEAKSVAYFLSPPDVKGTAFLVWENKDRANDVFIYLPELKRVRRIASEQKHQSFMGSDFSYADMENEDVDNAVHTMLPEQELNGKPCWVIQSIPKPESDSEYGKLITWVSKDNTIPEKIEFSDKKGKSYKIMTVLKIGPVGNEILPLDFTMENVQKNHKTEIILDNIKLNQQIPDDEFTQRAIQRN